MRPAITDISQWVERFSLMAAILATRFPLKAPEFWAYQATIVRAERNYEGTRWVAYDRQFRRDLNWSVTDTRLYNEAFTGRARAIARCSFCLQDDHAAASCPQNPNRPVFGWFPDPTAWAGAGVGAGSMVPQPTVGRQTTQQTAGREACRRYNAGKCRSARCRYLHSCSVPGSTSRFRVPPQARGRPQPIPREAITTGTAAAIRSPGQTLNPCTVQNLTPIPIHASIIPAPVVTKAGSPIIIIISVIKIIWCKGG